MKCCQKRLVREQEKRRRRAQKIFYLMALWGTNDTLDFVPPEVKVFCVLAPITACGQGGGGNPKTPGHFYCPLTGVSH
jgi:hypothetical protein